MKKIENEKLDEMIESFKTRFARLDEEFSPQLALKKKQDIRKTYANSKDELRKMACEIAFKLNKEES